MSGSTTSSTLLLDELLEAGDAGALPELLGSRAQRRLGPLARSLFDDPRPFARQVLLGYVDDGCSRPGHRVFVKTLFKAAEKAKDLELLAHFAVAFDRLVRRRLVTESRWDWGERRTVTQTLLRDPPETELPRRLPRWRRGGRTYTNPVTQVATRVRRPHIPLAPPRLRWAFSQRSKRWESTSEGGGEERADPLVFSLSTRRYLQRRVWRFFRGLAKADPTAYRDAMLRLLPHYADEALASPEALLDAWTLVHALYGKSPVLDRFPLGVRVAQGQSLSALAFAPYAPEAWKDCFEPLLRLATTAGARPVRRFALWALEQHHRAQLDGLDAQALLSLLQCRHPEVQALGAALLDTARGLEALPIDAWLSLLALPDLAVLARVCAAVKRHVAPGRLTLAQCVQLACAGAAPVAELGLEWVRARPLKAPAELEEALRLRHAGVETVRRQGVEWVVQQLLLEDRARPLLVRELLDARYVDVRASALSLMQKDQRFGEAVELWLAMSETPYPDVRDRFLADFEAREQAFPPESLQRVWATTLLAVHRGSRAKQRAVRQVAERAVAKPAEAPGLLELLGHSLRSVREPERRAALAHLVRAATHDASFRALLEQKLPGLRFLGEGVTS